MARKKDVDIKKFLIELMSLSNKYKINIDPSRLVYYGRLTPLGYIVYKYLERNKIDKIVEILSLEPGIIIIKKQNGNSLFEYPDVKLYHDYLYNYWKPFKTDFKILMPCTQVKPYGRSITHKMISYYIRELRSVGISIVKYSVSEPMLLVPEYFETLYPMANYDFPPKIMSDNEKELMARLLAPLIKKIIRATRIKVIAVLPRHHMSILERSLKFICRGKPRKVVLFNYGSRAFRTFKNVYSYVLQVWHDKS